MKKKKKVITRTALGKAFLTVLKWCPELKLKKNNNGQVTVRLLRNID
jgi:hypothetical protein